MSIRNIVNTIERKVIAAKNHSVGKEKAEMVEKLTHCDGPMMLRTENLVKKYRQRTVVNHVSINVKQGEIVGLLGPNGCWLVGQDGKLGQKVGEIR